ncbi:VWA domain-containing protein [Nanoarchaeota archaeon]
MISIKKYSGILSIFLVMGVLLLALGCTNIFPIKPPVDDWLFNGSMMYEDDATGGVNYRMYNSAPVQTTKMVESFDMAAGDSIGFSVGGSKDINNFRNNIENDFLPIATDVTHEGLFYDYYFDTGLSKECEKLFCPSYTYAISEDPFSNDDEFYLSVGLNSGIKESDFERKKLNLVVVLDISGSMGSSFNKYYYDQFGNRQENDISEEDMKKTKIEVASEAIVDLLGHLEDDDYFSMVLFDDSAVLAKGFNQVGQTDMDAIEEHILELYSRGGTRMSAGYDMASDQFDELLEIDYEEYENRIIFLTDAQPNQGDLSEEGMLGRTKSNADKGIYTTFIGIGVDFNTELIEKITKIKGANYYSVQSNKEFEERMDEGFEFMVTPLVFDLELKLEADGYEIVKVYGSPEADEATGEIMYVNTLFPSKTEGGETKGGIVLLKLKKIDSDGTLKLKVSYEDRNGVEDSSEEEISFGSESADFYDNTGIRKAILLSRYANLAKNWIIDEREAKVLERPVDEPCYECGIVIPPDHYELGRWERQSTPLEVSSQYQEMFSDFMDYFEDEMDEIGDETLSKELEILAKLAGEITIQ